MYLATLFTYHMVLKHSCCLRAAATVSIQCLLLCRLSLQAVQKSQSTVVCCFLLISLQLCDSSLFSPILCSGMSDNISHMDLKKLLEATSRLPKKKLLDFALCSMRNDCNSRGSGLVLVSNTDHALVFVCHLIPLSSSAMLLAWPVSAGVAFIGLVFVCRLCTLRPPASAVALCPFFVILLFC